MSAFYAEMETLSQQQQQPQFRDHPRSQRQYQRIPPRPGYFKELNS
jgi:hypothetical protein